MAHIDVPNSYQINNYVSLLLNLDPNNSYNHCIKLLVDNDCNISDKVRRLLITHYNKTNTTISKIIKLKDNVLLLSCIEKVDILDKDLENLCKQPSFEIKDDNCSFNRKTYSSMSKLIEIFINKGAKPTVTCLEYRLLYCDWLACEIILNSNSHTSNPNNKCLSLACYYHKIDLVKRFMNCKLLPDRISFHSIFQNERLRPSYYDYSMDYKYESIKSNVDYKEQILYHNTVSELTELFFKFGYNVTYDDILQLMHMKVIIKDYQKFGIVLDHKYLEKAWELDFFPYTCDITPTIELLYHIASLKDFYSPYSGDSQCSRIEKLLKKHYNCKEGLKPDQKLLELLSMNKNSIGLITKLMKKYGVKPSIQSIINVAKVHDEKFMALLFEKYKDKDIQIGNKDNQDIQLDNQDPKNKLDELYKIITEDGTVIKVKEYITNNNIKPDTKALEIACSSKVNKIAEYLINEHNVTVNATCIKAAQIHLKTKYASALIDFYDFIENVDTDLLKETKDSIVPSKYKGTDRVTYFCRLNNPLEKFQSIRDDFQKIGDSIITFSKLNIIVDKNNNIIKVDHKLPKISPVTHVQVNIVMDILYNIETIAINKKKMNEVLSLHRDQVISSHNRRFIYKNLGKHTVYIQSDNYPFDKEAYVNYKCHIKDYPFESYVKHSPKDVAKEQIKTVNVSPFYLLIDTFNSKLVPILGEKLIQN